MDVYLKAVAAVLITTMLCLILAKQGKDFSLLLSVCVCGMVFAAVVIYLKPVISFVHRLTELCDIDSQLLEILLKSVGVAILAEIGELVCKDAGNNTLGKTLQILATAVILWLSIPILNELIDLMEAIFKRK